MQLRENLVSRRSPIFDASMVGVERLMQNIWNRQVVDPKLNVVLSTSYQVRKHIKSMIDLGKEDTFPLPYLAIVPTLSARSTEGYNAFALSRVGVRVGLINDGAQEIRERLVPIDQGLGVRFVTRNSQEAQAFTEIWQRQQLSARFSLVHPEGGSTISIKVLFDPQINIPEQDFGGDPGDLIILDTALIVKTYIGDTEMNTTVKHVDFATISRDTGGFEIQLLDRRFPLDEDDGNGQ